jgi:hypothetical protein
METGTNALAFLWAAYVVMIGGVVGYSIWLAIRWKRVNGSKP